jgi:hypothetical protein
MTHKEKAQELVDKFMPHSTGNSNSNEAIECALIAIDEIIDLLEDNGLTFAEYHDKTTIEYWFQVKQEVINYKQKEQ